MFSGLNPESSDYKTGVLNSQWIF